MDRNTEVKKRERLMKCILKLKDNKLTGVRIESSGSRKPIMLQKSLNNLKESGNRETEMDKSSMEKSIKTKTLMLKCEVERLTFKWNVLLRMLRRILRFSTLYGPRVEIIETRDWKSGVLAKDLLGEQETTRRNRVGLLRHNYSDTVCSGIYGNREFPRRDCLSSRVCTSVCGNPI
ncbi:hypothetical protein F2Q68_00029477 [Brassica cretica]|uniref:Uncharacterized protein n=1 Tax=Brassica cretica TaxID=69181 RepID=A0A8S9GIF5_BRACR|nr:hypothetical protein F2Q68_00029477 [Brassica cretica]